MRKTVIDSLFPRTRQGILAATFVDANRWWFLSELARHLRLSASSLQRELESLTAAGVLRQKREGKHVYFQANTDSPLFFELRGIVFKTVGIVDVLRRFLKPFQERIDVAFVFGSVARREENAASDVDLMIVGQLPLSEVSPAIREAEEAIGRPINAIVYTPDDLAEKVQAKHHFVVNVKESKKLFVFGEPNDLVKIIGK